jgi:hypothetical protein
MGPLIRSGGVIFIRSGHCVPLEVGTVNRFANMACVARVIILSVAMVALPAILDYHKFV